MRRIGLCVAVAVAAVGLVSGCSVSGSSGGAGGKGSAGTAGRGGDAKAPEGHKPEDDVKLTACSKAEFGNYPQAKLRVTNQSAKTSDYIVQVEFLDPAGTRKAEGTAALNNLAHGQTAEETAAGLAEVAGEVKCRITKVTRTASL